MAGIRRAFGDVVAGPARESELGRPRGLDLAAYFRVHGPATLIEHANTQNNANHIHSVWRDLAADFGRWPIITGAIPTDDRWLTSPLVRVGAADVGVHVGIGPARVGLPGPDMQLIERI